MFSKANVCGSKRIFEVSKPVSSRPGKSESVFMD